jgi:hypothetical protein
MSLIGRRGFLGAVAGVAVAGAGAGAASAHVRSALTAPLRTGLVETLTAPLRDDGPPKPLARDRFTGIIGHPVVLGASGRSVTARLVEVADVKGAPAGHPTQFSLILEAAAQSGLPQGTHRVRAAGLDDLQLLVVPVDRAVRSQHYQITFNNPG